MPPAAAAAAARLEHDGVDIGYDALAQSAALDASPAESTTREAAARISMSWTDLTFSVPLKGAAKKKAAAAAAAAAADGDGPSGPARKVILDRIGGRVDAGQMLCVVGPSGSGKTSLLQIIAGRASATAGAEVSGSVLVNDAPRDFSTFTKVAAYVQQDDDMFGELTVREQISYAANLRLPSSLSRERKALRVDRVVQELGLGKVADAKIGNATIRGVSGGERKRVSIGTELVADSSVLFLDEPTSGLDSFNALNVVTTLRRLASNGRTVISTIHQPRSSIFSLFDMLLVLAEGRTIYFGPARDAVPYFSALRFPAPPTFNPADFFLDVVSIDPRSKEFEADTVARVDYLAGKYSASVAAPPPPLNPTAAAARTAVKAVTAASFERSWANEFRILSSRAMKIASRAKIANAVRAVQTVFFGIVLSLLWAGNGRSKELVDRASLSGLFFFIAINQAFIGVFSVIFDFPVERSVVTRERASSTYRTSSYYLSKMVTDLPRSMFYAVLFTVAVYFTVGLKLSIGSVLRFYLVTLGVSNFGEALAITISVVTGNAQTSAAIAPVLIIISVLFAGFFTQTGQIPGFVRWIKWISFVYFSANAFAQVEFPDRAFGAQILKDGGYNDLSYWVNMAGLLAIIVALRLIGYLALKFLRGPRFLSF